MTHKIHTSAHKHIQTNRDPFGAREGRDVGGRVAPETSAGEKKTPFDTGELISPNQ